MVDNKVFAALQKLGVINTEGQFVSIDPLYVSPFWLRNLAGELGVAIFSHCKESGIGAVVGSSAGGNFSLAHLLAHQLSLLFGGRKEVLSVFLDRGEEKEIEGERVPTFSLRPTFAEAIKGKPVFVVDGVLQTGRTVKGMCHTLVEAHASVVGIGVICQVGKAFSGALGINKLLSVVEVPAAKAQAA